MIDEEYIPDLEFEFEHQYDHYNFIAEEQFMLEQWSRESHMERIIYEEYEENIRREKMCFDEYEDALLQIENWNGEVLDV